MIRAYALTVSILTIAFCLTAQDFSTDEYSKALWMTTRMYGGQRSGQGPNWLIMDHGSGVDFVDDADGGYDLSGGWHDCGDHVKFGQTQFYSAYVLLKAYAEFPEGFDDFYSFDYHGYQQAGDFTWEGAKGVPNGIPDILDEVKYATDYFIKCARDDNTFYYQVGEGDKDHKHWVTSVTMATLSSSEGGQPRAAFKNPSGASMASFCGATLALMSRVYRKFDDPYADECLAAALHAYQYAKAHPGTVGSSFYPANAKWEDDFVLLTSELYWATGEQKYLDDALSKAGSIGDHNWCLCYNQNDELAMYNLARLGSDVQKNNLKNIVNRYKGNVTGDGVGRTGDSWGILRYSAAQAFVTALYAKLDGADDVDQFIYDNLDYIMGGNSRSYSFIVGFGANHASHPHHRNVYLNDDDVSDDQKNSLSIPQRNRQFGYLVGGSLDPNSYTDDINNYSSSEGGIDYNSGLVGALGYVMSMRAPVDTSEFDPTWVRMPKQTGNTAVTAMRAEMNIRLFSLNGRSLGSISTGETQRMRYAHLAGGVYVRVLPHEPNGSYEACELLQAKGLNEKNKH